MPNDIDDTLERAIGMHKAGRGGEARELYDEVLVGDPGNVQALSVSAILLFQTGQKEEAIARLTHAIEIAPGEAGLFNNLGRMLMAEDRLEEAVAAYQRALMLNPDLTDALCNAGVIARQMGRRDEARAFLERAVELDRGHIEANHNLGMLHASLGNNNEAADAFERCYLTGVVPPVSVVYHARVFKMIGRDDRAREVMQQYLASRPDDPIVQHEAAAVIGTQSEAPNEGYVKAKFDRFAASFDATLGRLDYRGPEVAAKEVEELCNGQRVGLIADLGCGTGMLGPLVRGHARELVGVDLSEKMLLKAAVREVDGTRAYDKLFDGDVVQYLESVPHGSIDIAVALDSLIYVGKLEAFMAAISRALRKGGALIATFEWTHSDQADGYRLLESGRYAHSNLYVSELARHEGMLVRSARLCSLRQEFGEELPFTLQVIENMWDPTDKAES